MRWMGSRSTDLCGVMGSVVGLLENGVGERSDGLVLATWSSLRSRKALFPGAARLVLDEIALDCFSASPSGQL